RRHETRCSEIRPTSARTASRRRLEFRQPNALPSVPTAVLTASSHIASQTARCWTPIESWFAKPNTALLTNIVRGIVVAKQRNSQSFFVKAFSLLKQTFNEWLQDKAPQLGAALAYYTVFSLAPLVLVLLAIVGVIFRYKPADALNTIWGVKAKPGTGIWGFLRARFLSFAMVGGICFLLLVSLAIEALLKGFSHYVQSVLPGGIVIAVTVYLVFDFAVVVLLFA